VSSRNNPGPTVSGELPALFLQAPNPGAIRLSDRTRIARQGVKEARDGGVNILRKQGDVEVAVVV